MVRTKLHVINGHCPYFKKTSKKVSLLYELDKFIPKRKPKPVNPEKVKRILVLKQDRIGDLFMSLPFFEVLKKEFPNAKVDLVIDQGQHHFVKYFPNIDRLIPYKFSKDFLDYAGMSSIRKRAQSFVKSYTSGEFNAIRKKIGKAKYDVGFDLLGRRRNYYLLNSLKIPVRAGFHLAAILGLITHGTKYEGYENISEQYIKTISTVLGKKVNYKYKPFKLSMKPNPKYKDYVLLHLSFGGESSRKWDAKNFATLANKIMNKHKIIVVSSPYEKELAAEVRKLLDKDVIVYTNPLTDLIRLVISVKYFIGVDGGPLHVSDLVGTPTLMLFSRETPKKWGAVGDRSVEIKGIKGVCERRHCGWNYCMNSITPELVYDLFEEHYEKTKNL